MLGPKLFLMLIFSNDYLENASVWLGPLKGPLCWPDVGWGLRKAGLKDEPAATALALTLISPRRYVQAERFAQ
jgi:hypothetical protein